MWEWYWSSCVCAWSSAFTKNLYKDSSIKVITIFAANCYLLQHGNAPIWHLGKLAVFGVQKPKCKCKVKSGGNHETNYESNSVSWLLELLFISGTKLIQQSIYLLNLCGFGLNNTQTKKWLLDIRQLLNIYSFIVYLYCPKWTRQLEWSHSNSNRMLLTDLRFVDLKKKKS